MLSRITLPPLRERQEDIELLVHYFLHLHTRRLGSVYPGIAPDVVEILRKHRLARKPARVKQFDGISG